MDEKLQLFVAKREMITPAICRFELRRRDGGALPPFEAGAHIRVRTPMGVVRSYSLSNDDSETERYVIAVKREERSRGGSASLHDSVAEGDTLIVTPPRNLYALKAARNYLLIAGGIGITPIIAIFRRLMRQGVRDVTLIYCTRSPEETAYLDELRQARYQSYVRLHHTATAGGRFDFWPFLRNPDDTAMYYCGPAPFMDAIYAQSIHWPRRALHFENFAGPSSLAGPQPFSVRRASSGDVFEIPADKTILDVLRAAGLKPSSSCESGTCGTCRMRLLAGVPDHRDVVLTQVEQCDFLMPCVSRAYGGELTLGF